MGKNQDNHSLWSKISQLMSKISTLLGKKIENWTKMIEKEIIEDNSGKGQTPAMVVNMGEPNVKNQSVRYETETPSSPATVINKTKVSVGLSGILFWGIIIYAFFSVPDRSDHVEEITKQIYDICKSENLLSDPKLAFIDEDKIKALYENILYEGGEYENYYLFSVYHKKSDYYDFGDVLDGNFMSLGICGKVFVFIKKENIEESISREKSDREMSVSHNSHNTTGYHSGDKDSAIDNSARYDGCLQIVKNTQQFGDEIESYAHGCDYQVTHTVVVANHADYSVPGSAYCLIVSPEDSNEDEYGYSRTNTREVQGKTIPANETATFSWTDVHFDGTWSYVDKVDLKILEI